MRLIAAIASAAASFSAMMLACSPTRESLAPPREALPELIFPPAAERQATCVAHGQTVRCVNLDEVREVEIEFEVKSVTGTTDGGLCVVDQQGRFLFWSYTEGVEHAPTIEEIGAVTVVPDGTGCCAYSDHIEVCRGGEFEGRESYPHGLEVRYGGPRIPVKAGNCFLMVDPTVAMSHEEWEEISYYRSLAGPNEKGPWFEEFPGDNTFLRNALLSACGVAPPRDPFCSTTSAIFDFVGTTDVVELIFGLQVACVLLADERLLCHGPGGRREESGVIDVDVGTGSICVATRTEFECWPISDVVLP